VENKLKKLKIDMFRESMELVLKKKRKVTVEKICRKGRF